MKTSNRISRQELYAGMVELLAKRSDCLRLNVGALVVYEGRIIATGYNAGLRIPKGNIVPCQIGCDMNMPCKKTVHAEQNIIAFAARHGIKLKGGTLYITHSPCEECAKLIVQAGIKEIFYINEFRDKTPVDNLNFIYGIPTKKIEPYNG